jgi:LysR family glycine cleavage system transcriptional activator
MHRRLPPFRAIHAFEAAARHLSFTAAADELCVTPSAVSHQVRALEEHLGVALFERHPTGVALTAAGALYREDLTVLLDGLDACTLRVRDTDPDGPLAIRTTPGFATRWLIPRLARFKAAHPGIDVSVSTGLPPTDFSRGDLDVFVHWGDEPVPGVEVEPFLTAAKIAVASPGLVARDGAVRQPADVLRHTLIRDEIGDAWPEWFARAHIPGPVPPGGPRFAHCDLVLNAAEGGLGIALVYDALAAASLAAGTLVPLFEIRTDPVLIYSLAWHRSRSDNPRIRAFRRWIRAEAGTVSVISQTAPAA